MTRRKPWSNYPARFCLTTHECDVCGRKITYGQRYYDAKRRRAHLDCGRKDDNSRPPE